MIGWPFATRRALDQERAASTRLLRQIIALSADLSAANDELRRLRRQVAALNAEAERRAVAAEALQQRRADWAHAARQGLHVVVAGDGGRAA